MRKQNLLKLAFTMLAMIVMTGAMAQNPSTIATDYENVAETIYQTTGLGLRLYASPDPVLHPNYVAAEVAGNNPNDPLTLNATSEWRWVHGADFATGTQVKDWTVRENWVELVAGDLPAAGSSRTFWVAERFGAFGCDPTSTSKTVAVVAAPVITSIAAQGTGDWEEVVEGTEYKYCGQGLTDVIDVALTEAGNDAGLQEFTYEITALRTAYDFNMDAIPAQTDVDVTGTLGQNVDLDGMIAGLAHSFNVPALNYYLDGTTVHPTKYVFNIAANSLTSKVSRLSHYRAGIANVPYNNVPATTITYWLYPVATTGPIYHIPNDFAY